MLIILILTTATIQTPIVKMPKDHSSAFVILVSAGTLTIAQVMSVVQSMMASPN